MACLFHRTGRHRLSTDLPVIAARRLPLDSSLYYLELLRRHTSILHSQLLDNATQRAEVNQLAN